MTITAPAGRLSLGKVAYHLYFRPRSTIKAALKRGIANTIGDRRHHAEMRQAARSLPHIKHLDQDSCDIYYLTGQRFWHQTLFCAWSLARTGNISVNPILVDDGTLSRRNLFDIRRVFPAARIQTIEQSESQVDKFLPRSQFPHLRARRDVYPNLRKLIDVHAGAQGWKLVLDSDMLFFREPCQLINWLQNPVAPCHMVDCETSYGYPLEFLSRQCGHQVAERVNVGVTGLCSELIDWKSVESWLAEQNRVYGTSYYQEQALIAQLMAGQSCTVLDASDYQVLPSRSEVEQPKAVLHHYVADSKPWYYRYGWRQALGGGH